MTENHDRSDPVTGADEIRRLVTLVVDEVMAGGGSDAETVAIGADHGGFHLKETLIEHLQGRFLDAFGEHLNLPWSNQLIPRATDDQGRDGDLVP